MSIGYIIVKIERKRKPEEETEEEETKSGSKTPIFIHRIWFRYYHSNIIYKKMIHTLKFE